MPNTGISRSHRRRDRGAGFGPNGLRVCHHREGTRALGVADPASFERDDVGAGVLRGRHEVVDDIGDLVRRLHVGEVPDAGQHLQPDRPAGPPARRGRARPE